MMQTTFALWSEEPARSNRSHPVTIEGISQQEHTTDKFGRYMHPFAQAEPNATTIYYKDSKTVSTKLDRVPGPSMYTDGNDDLHIDSDWSLSSLLSAEGDGLYGVLTSSWSNF